MTGKALENIQNILLRDESHLAVNLGKLRLAVGTQIFIPETFNNLEITVEPAYH